MIKRIKLTSLFLFICLFLLPNAWAQEEGGNNWPREIKTEQAVVIIYQPQPEKFADNHLEGRFAVSIETNDSDEPIFGAAWFKARLETDRDKRMATIADLSVTRVRLPDVAEDRHQEFVDLLEREIPKWDLPISMERLIASLKLADQRIKAADTINTDPPIILFLDEPAVLISIDGEPRLKQEEDSDIMRVVNTPYTLLLNPLENKYYLYADKDTWYRASDIKGEWAIVKTVPSEISKRAPEEEPDAAPQADAEDKEKPGPPPKIVVATEPTELISSTGPAEYTPIVGTDLLYMSNSDSDMLLHITTQTNYVLLTGRWYKSSTLQGPWKYVPGDKLPPDFAKIPEDSEMNTVLYSIPGTDASKDAVLDAQIPQTATVERDKASLTVTYDGKPKFEDIKGTAMAYAVNTETPVIQLKKRYYACDQAVWFVADNAEGPWMIATSIPDEIYTIPPECPVYNVTFVKVYDSTPKVVYVGYTSGYTHTYVYHGTIIYGTGYYYPYWYGTWYYPHPITYGYHVRYNPWMGWGFGWSYCSGPYRFTIGVGGWYRGGWWGPGHYRGYRHGYRHGYRNGARAGYRAGSRTSHNQNMYRSKRNKDRVKPGYLSANNRARASSVSDRANNVFTDKNGNVHRRTDQGWEKRTKDGWKPDKGQTKPTQHVQSKPAQTLQLQTDRSVQRPSSGLSSNTQQLERSHRARQRGTQNTNSYKRSMGGNRQGGGAARGGGGVRGGGIRR